MLGFRPYRFYFYMWKFVSPLCMAVLTTASIIQLGVTPPGYSAWIREEVRVAAGTLTQDRGSEGLMHRSSLSNPCLVPVCGE